MTNHEPKIQHDAQEFTSDVVAVRETPTKKQHIDTKTEVKIALIAVVVTVVILYLAWDLIFNGPIMQLLSNRDQMVNAINSLGIFGPLLYMALQVLQTVVAPIPGQIVGSIGGFLFGPWGILWTTIGSSIGAYIVFKLARKFGRPLMEKLFKKSVISKFEFILDAKSAPFILFAIFLLPGLPDDLVCYLAGLTNVPIKKLMVLLVLGHLPSIIVTNFFGDGASENLPLVIAIGALTLIVLGIGVWQRERIIDFLKKTANGTKSPLQKPTKKSNKESS